MDKTDWINNKLKNYVSFKGLLLFYGLLIFVFMLLAASVV